MKKEKFHKKFTCFRFSDEVAKKIQELKKGFPNDYNSDSDVLRSGVITLHRWKFRYENKMEVD